MTPTGMAHEMAREELEAYVLDALSAAERAAVMAHVSRCVACQKEVAVLQAAAAELSYVVKPVSLPDAQRDRVRARLLSRARVEGPSALPVATPASTTAPAQVTVLMPPARTAPSAAATADDSAEFHPSPAFHIMVPHSAASEAVLHPRRMRWLNSGPGYVAVAASFIAVVSVGMLFQVMRERNGLVNALQVVSAQRGGTADVTDSLRSALIDRERLIANLTGPQVAVVNLASAGVRSPNARMFWDQPANAWTFVAHNLPRPRSGRIYQLWLVTANQKISAGVFTPLANGDAVVRATYALPPGTLAAVAVTDEPETGSPQPTTVPLIVGSAR